MTSFRYNNRPIIFGLAFSLCAVSASAQVPPPETNALTLVDAGPVSVPAACPCITNPFTVPTIRPGWGYPSGPAAPLATRCLQQPLESARDNVMPRTVRRLPQTPKTDWPATLTRAPR